ncbi:MAG: stage II sporulation protein M [Flavobacteriales bacterium]
MQETEFIGQNKKKWKEFEETLKSSNKDPDHLTQLFIETTDDLSFSQTHYPNRSVRVYLNSVSQKVYQLIYKRKRKEKNKVKSLWRSEIPSSLYFAQKALFFSLVLFLLGITIGVFSNMFYPDFASIVLSPGYVEMTEEYIANGDPMAVYKSRDAFEMFVTIAMNNIRISFAAFVLGLLWGVGTAWVLFSNGIMFGAFMHFFFTRGLWKASILAVMQHGTLELSMIVVSGAAGFVLAKGLIFPGTFSRIDALVISSRNAIKIMIPVFFFLSYTRHLLNPTSRVSRSFGCYSSTVDSLLSLYDSSWILLCVPEIHCEKRTSHSRKYR